MKRIQPDYFDDFQCLAGACSDSCCVGWEIDVDEETGRRYRELPGELGDRLRDAVSDKGMGRFNLKDGRCPFLNADNLCDIILQRGDGWLCGVCREHPRFYEWLDGRVEAGLGLCCEAAGRLIFRSSAPARFVESETEETGADAGDELQAFLLSARERAFSLLRDRNLTICDRLAALLSLALDVQDGVDMGDLSMPMEGGALRGRPKAEDFAEMLRFFEALEPIDPRWPGTLARMRGNLDGLLEAAPRFLAALGEGVYAYEHLAVYYVYRYWMKAAFDGELLSRMKFALCGLLVQLLWDVDRWVRTGGYTPDDRVESAKAFSKEMEYGPDNLAAFLKKSWELDCFSSEAIGGMLGICRCE